MSLMISEFGTRGPCMLPGIAVSPYGARTFFVHHNAPGAFKDLPDAVSGNLFPSWQKAMTQVETDRGDIVQLLPGHAENINSATYLTQSTSTIPRGWTLLGPAMGKPAVLTWSIAGAKLVISSADIAIDGGRSDGTFGIKFELAGPPTSSTALTVAAPVDITAARFKVARVDMGAGVDVDQLIGIGFTCSAAADQFAFIGNRVRGAAAATMTTLIRLNGNDDAYIVGNDIVCATSAAAVGPIQALTVAPINANISRNFIQNNAAASTACITTMAAMSGVISDNRLRNMTDGSNAQIVITGAVTQEFENYGVNNDAERGIILGTASA